METYVKIWSSNVTPRFYMGSTAPDSTSSNHLSRKDHNNNHEYVSAKLTMDNYQIRKIELDISLSKSVARKINLVWQDYLDTTLGGETMENLRQSFLKLSPEQQQNLNGIKVPGVGLSHYMNIFYLQLVGVTALLTILSYSQDALGNPLEPLNPSFPSVDITPELITQQTGSYLYALCQGLTKIPLQTLGVHLAHLTQGFFSIFGSCLVESNDHCSNLEVSSANLDAMAAISSYYNSDTQYISTQIETVRKDLNLLENSLGEYIERVAQIDAMAQQRQKAYFNTGFTKIVGMSVQASNILHQSLKSIKAEMDQYQQKIYQYINRIGKEEVDQILANGRQQAMALSSQLQYYQEEMIKLGQNGEQALKNQKEGIKQLVKQAEQEAKIEAEEIKVEIAGEYQIVHQKAREEVTKLQNRWKELLFQMEQEVKIVETGCKEELKQEQITLQQTLVEQQRLCITNIQEHTRLLLEQQDQVSERISQLINQSEVQYNSMEEKIQQSLNKTLLTHVDTIREEMETFLATKITQLEQRFDQEINSRLSQDALTSRNEALVKTMIDKMVKQQMESIFNNKLAEVDKRLKTANLIYQQSLLTNEQSGLMNKNIPKTTIVKAKIVNSNQSDIPSDLLDDNFHIREVEEDMIERNDHSISNLTNQHSIIEQKIGNTRTINGYSNNSHQDSPHKRMANPDVSYWNSSKPNNPYKPNVTVFSGEVRQNDTRVIPLEQPIGYSEHTQLGQGDRPLSTIQGNKNGQAGIQSIRYPNRFSDGNPARTIVSTIE